MKRALLALLLIAAVGLLVAEGVLRDSGLVRVVWGDWAIETSLWLALAASFVAWLVLRVLLRFLLAVWRSPGRVSDWWGALFLRRRQRLTRAGLRAYLEADWRQAARLLLKGADGSGDRVINRLFAAQARLRSEDRDGAERLLSQLETEVGEADVPVALLRTALLLEAGDHEAALARLLWLRQQRGDHPGVLVQLAQAWRALQDWHNLETLLPRLKKNTLLPPDALLQLEFDVYAGLLNQSQAVDAAHSRVQTLNQVWRNLPSRSRRQPAVVAAYARALLQAQAWADAEKALRQALKQQFSDELIDLYGRVPLADAGKALVFAETLLPAHPNHAGLLLCLGRLSLRHRLWGKARDYFQAALAQQASPENCAELARLLDALGETEAARRYRDRGLQLSAPALPALPLPAASTV